MPFEKECIRCPAEVLTRMLAVQTCRESPAIPVSDTHHVLSTFEYPRRSMVVTDMLSKGAGTDNVIERPGRLHNKELSNIRSCEINFVIDALVISYDTIIDLLCFVRPRAMQNKFVSEIHKVRLEAVSPSRDSIVGFHELNLLPKIKVLVIPEPKLEKLIFFKDEGSNELAWDKLSLRATSDILNLLEYPGPDPSLHITVVNEDQPD